MRDMQKQLGFRVSGSPNSCIDHRQIEILEADGETVKAVRPASRQEVEMWDTLLDYTQAFQANSEAMVESHNKWVALHADNESLRTSCDAYREQLQKLHDGLAHKYPIAPTDDAIEYALTTLASRELGLDRLRNKAREIWQIPPGTDIIEFMFQQLRHLNGEAMSETEQRRQNTIANRAQEMQLRSAGERVDKS